MGHSGSTMENSFSGKWLMLVATSLRKLIVFCLSVALLSSVWALTRTQRWEAAAVTMVPGGQSSVMSQLGGLGELAGSLLSGSQSSIPGLASMGMGTSGSMDITLVQQVLGSRSVMERVILKYDLVHRFHSPSMDVAMQKLGKIVTISLTPENLLIVEAQGESREEAAAMVNDIVAFANEELSTIVTSRARRSRIIAEQSVLRASDSLDAALSRQESFRLETGLIFPEEQGTGMINLLGSLETDLAVAESQLAGIGSTMSYSSQLYREVSGTVQYLRGALERRMTDGDSLSMFPGVEELPNLLREYESISTDVEVKRLIYLMLRQEVETLRLQEAEESPTLEVLIPATPSALRAYPKRGMMVVKNTLIALLIAFLWLAVVAYARDLLDRAETGPFWKSFLTVSRAQLLPHRHRDRGVDRPL
jgi:capsular polysaccharide transport system permease protein